MFHLQTFKISQNSERFVLHMNKDFDFYRIWNVCKVSLTTAHSFQMQLKSLPFLENILGFHN